MADTTIQRASLAKLFELLGSSEKGLTTEEARRRLSKFGPNELTSGRRAGNVLQILLLFANPLVIILLIASFVSALLGERLNATIIAVMVLLSVALNFSAEVRAVHVDCGEVTTMVLVPEVIDAIKPIRRVPVLAAGGIVTGRQMAAAIALGADGVWTGSVWLTTEEAETAPYTKQRMIAATSRDTVRSRSRTGKPSRQLKSGWTEAWDADKSPGVLPMPLQSLLSEPVMRRIDVLAEQGNPGAQELATYWVGQGVGLMNKATTVRDVIYEMSQDFADAAEHLAQVLAD